MGAMGGIKFLWLYRRWYRRGVYQDSPSLCAGLFCPRCHYGTGAVSLKVKSESVCASIVMWLAAVPLLLLGCVQAKLDWKAPDLLFHVSAEPKGQIPARCPIDSTRRHTADDNTVATPSEESPLAISGCL